LTSAVQSGGGWNRPISVEQVENQLKVVSLLLEKKADVSMLDPKGRLPIAECWNVEVARLLIAAGADPMRPNQAGFSLLFTACSGGWLNVIQFLVEESNVDVTKCLYADRTVLQFAIWIKKTKIVKWLVKNTILGELLNEPEVHDLSEFGGTPLYKACSCKSREIVTFLLAQSADPNQRIKNGKLSATPIMAAAEIGSHEIV